MKGWSQPFPRASDYRDRIAVAGRCAAVDRAPRGLRACSGERHTVLYLSGQRAYLRAIHETVRVTWGLRLRSLAGARRARLVPELTSRRGGLVPEKRGCSRLSPAIAVKARSFAKFGQHFAARKARPRSHPPSSARLLDRLPEQQQPQRPTQLRDSDGLRIGALRSPGAPHEKQSAPSLSKGRVSPYGRTDAQPRVLRLSAPP